MSKTNKQEAIERLEALLAEYETLALVPDERAHPPSMTYDALSGQPLTDWQPPMIKHSPALQIRMRQAVGDIAPNSSYAKHNERFKSLSRVVEGVTALLTDIRNGHFKFAPAQPSIGDLTKPETPPRS